jgi:hypothetical protein
MGKQYFRLFVALAALATLAFAFLAFPRVAALYYVYLGRDSYQSLFYEGFGLGQSASSVLSAISVFALLLRVGPSIFFAILHLNKCLKDLLPSYLFILWPQ